MTGRLGEAEKAYRQALAVHGRNLRLGVNRELEAGKRKIIEIALQGLAEKLNRSERISLLGRRPGGGSSELFCQVLCPFR